MASTDQATDPLAETEKGDTDPIGPFDPDNICGATVQTYPGGHHRVECLRDPHPPHWLHVSTCDDQVDYVWRDLRPAEAAEMVVTDEGVVCRGCGHEVTTDPNDHYFDCQVGRSAPTDDTTRTPGEVYAVHAGALALALHDADCGCDNYDQVEDPRYIDAVRRVLDARDVTPRSTVLAAESVVGNMLMHASDDVDPGEMPRAIVAEVRQVLPTPIAWAAPTDDTTPPGRPGGIVDASGWESPEDSGPANASRGVEPADLDTLTGWVETALDSSDIRVTVQEEDGSASPLRRLVRCLRSAGLLDETAGYEEDEPVEKIRAILQRPPDGVTAPPDDWPPSCWAPYVALRSFARWAASLEGRTVSIADVATYARHALEFDDRAAIRTAGTAGPPEEG